MQCSFAGNKILISALILILAAGFSLPVFGVEYGGFGGRPAFPRADNPRTESIFVHILSPGAIQEEGVMLVNNSAETKTLMVYAADSQISTGGAFACEQLSDEKNDVGAWIELAKSEVALEPGTNEIVPFTISVPETASVGEHNGCILIQEKKEPKEGQSGVQLSLRTGLRVAITIPGEIVRKIEITGFEVIKQANGNYFLKPRVKNLGNVSIDADVQVATKYFFGLTLLQHGGQYPILRGEVSDWNFELKKPLWGGWYKTSLTVEYDENQEAGVGVKSGKPLTKLQGPAIWFFSFPTPAGLAIEISGLLLIFAAVFFLWLARKRKKWIEKTWVEYTVKAGDDIQKLSQKFDVSWKLLVKVNKLNPPYALKAKEKIKVPPTG